MAHFTFGFVLQPQRDNAGRLSYVSENIPDNKPV